MSTSEDYKKGYTAGYNKGAKDAKRLIEAISGWASVLKARPNRHLTATQCYNTLTIITSINERGKYEFQESRTTDTSQAS